MNWWELADFYETKTNSRLEKGDIVFAPAIYLDEKQKILNIERASVDQTTHNVGKFSIEPFDHTKHFRQTAVTLPVYNIGLRINEELILNKSKMRPCIVLHIEDETIQKATATDNQVPDLNKKSVLLLPIYGFERGQTGKPKHSTEMQKRIMCLQYGKLLFVPKDGDRGSAITKDSFGRFDLAFNTPSSYIHCTRRKVSDDYVELLDLYMATYFGMPTTDDRFENAIATLQLAQGQYNE